MLLEDYFDFQAPDDIRIKGSRIGIETVLHDWLHRARTPEEIAAAYPSVNREQVYATITYYLRNQAEVDRYIAEWLEFGRRMRAEQAKDQSPWLVRMRKLIAERQLAGAVEIARAGGPSPYRVRLARGS
jgi:uncharacterized protein (DUF433 family)